LGRRHACVLLDQATIWGGKLLCLGASRSLAFVSGAFAPMFLPHQLPAANAPEVVNLVQNLVEQSLSQQPDPAKFGKPTITNAVERSFDRKRQVRDVKCTLTTKLGPEDFYYTVEWEDRSKNLFRIKVRAQP
jgi:hypothetical protein